jgi:Fe-Mn family superoxide dismutase
MTYELPDLPYDVSALEPWYSAEILDLHYNKHHAAYVSGANAALEKLEEARSRGRLDGLVGLEKTLAFNVAGHVLHTTFWHNLSPEGGDKPDGALLDAIGDAFGSFDGFRAQLTDATTLVQGSGWGALVWEPLGKRLLVEQIYDHTGNTVPGAVPLLVFDAWEHAYYLQYRNVRGDYVEALWNIVNWADVGKRFEAARTMALP